LEDSGFKRKEKVGQNSNLDEDLSSKIRKIRESFRVRGAEQ
jgi:hypothetical protein